MKAPGWRIGDGGFTVFGPRTTKPAPEIIATVTKKEHARTIVHAVNAAPPAPLVVHLKVEGGVLDAYRIPAGVTLDIIDHDIEGTAPEDVHDYCTCAEGGGEGHRHWTEAGPWGKK